MDGDSASSKRRHSRPLELDSEGEENDTSGKEEELLSDREEEPEETEAPDRLLSGKVPVAVIVTGSEQLERVVTHLIPSVGEWRRGG